jgi:hypothetical protein
MILRSHYRRNDRQIEHGAAPGCLHSVDPRYGPPPVNRWRGPAGRREGEPMAKKKAKKKDKKDKKKSKKK